MGNMLWLEACSHGGGGLEAKQGSEHSPSQGCNEMGSDTPPPPRTPNCQEAAGALHHARWHLGRQHYANLSSSLSAPFSRIARPGSRVTYHPRSVLGAPPQVHCAYVFHGEDHTPEPGSTQLPPHRTRGPDDASGPVTNGSGGGPLHHRTIHPVALPGGGQQDPPVPLTSSGPAAWKLNPELARVPGCTSRSAKCLPDTPLHERTNEEGGLKRRKMWLMAAAYCEQIVALGAAQTKPSDLGPLGLPHSPEKGTAGGYPATARNLLAAPSPLNKELPAAAAAGCSSPPAWSCEV